MHTAREPRNQDNADTEKRGECQPYCRVRFYQFRPLQQFNDKDSEDTGASRRQNQERRRETLCEKEGEHNARENRVANRIAHQCHPPEDEEYAGQRACYCYYNSDELDFELMCHDSGISSR